MSIHGQAGGLGPVCYLTILSSSSLCTIFKETISSLIMLLQTG